VASELIFNPYSLFVNAFCGFNKVM
jgi:hypothetical protein